MKITLSPEAKNDAPYHAIEELQKAATSWRRGNLWPLHELKTTCCPDLLGADP